MQIQFVRTPFTLARNFKISHGAKSLYLLLGTYCRKDGTCFPSVGTLAQQMETADRVVQRYLRELTDHEYIKITHQTSRANLYTLVDLTHSICRETSPKLQVLGGVTYKSPGDVGVTMGVTYTSGGGDAGVTMGVTQESPITRTKRTRTKELEQDIPPLPPGGATPTDVVVSEPDMEPDPFLIEETQGVASSEPLLLLAVPETPTATPTPQRTRTRANSVNSYKAEYSRVMEGYPRPPAEIANALPNYAKRRIAGEFTEEEARGFVERYIAQHNPEFAIHAYNFWGRAARYTSYTAEQARQDTPAVFNDFYRPEYRPAPAPEYCPV